MKPEIFQFGDITVDAGAFHLERGGVPVSITPRAFDVLLFLVRNGGRIVEKQEIFDVVWGDSFVTDNALTRVIKEIRRGLGDDVSNPRYIETAPKRGYRFIATVSEPSAVAPVPSTARPINESTAESRNRLFTTLGLGIVLCLTALGVVLYVSKQPAKSAAGPIDSVAVMPFRNDSADPGAEYLADNITESLRNKLAQLPGLKVISEASAFRYKGKEQNLQQIAQELNVRALLTGSLKQVGDQLVINVSLDDAAEDSHIWGEQYVRKPNDILAIPSDIARQASANLRVRLSARDTRQIERRYTDNVEAYQLYAKGRSAWIKHSQPDFQKAIAYFNQSVEKDPNYALAYVGLSASYGALGNNYLPPREAFPRAKAYAEKALALDDELAGAHGVMAAIHLFYDWDFPEAEKEVLRALELDPNNAEAHQIYGDCLEIRGRFDEALVERERSQEIDPLSPMYGMVKGATFYFSRRYDEAQQQLVKTIELQPDFSPAYFFLGQSYEERRMYDLANSTYQSGMKKAERSTSLIAAQARTSGLGGDRERARKDLAQLEAYSRRAYVSPYLFALVHAGLGDTDDVFTSLNKAYDDRSYFMIWLKVEPAFDHLRSDARFEDLIRRMAL